MLSFQREGGKEGKEGRMSRRERWERGRGERDVIQKEEGGDKELLLGQTKRSWLV